jgi:hypothetical protein
VIPAAAPPDAQFDRRGDRQVQIRAAGWLAFALAVIGAVLGPVWEAWSPPGPVGAVLPAGIQADENEAFVAGDGRFVLITGLVGLAAGIVAWRVGRLRLARGPYVALGLGVGGLAGAAFCELVGNLVRGSGRTFSCSAASGRCIDHLPLTVHMHALLLAEPIAALLVYNLCVAFAAADDLGRPDPVGAVSGRPQDHPQQAGRDGDTAGPA